MFNTEEENISWAWWSTHVTSFAQETKARTYVQHTITEVKTLKDLCFYATI